ncbi:YopX family protein [Planococcus sp. SIMBA_160]
MSRDFKFRIWDQRVPGSLMSYDDGHFSISAHGEVFCVNDDVSIENDSFLMQYTGREDNTGVELYEGDIVEENDELSVCVWMDEAGAFLFVPAHLYPCDLTTLTTNHGNDTFFDNDSPEIYVRIVGNIYEHPYLLEGGEPDAT